MRNLLARVLRQPLIQFVLIGALIYGVHQWSSGGRTDAPSEIRVGEPELLWLHQTWQAQFGHAPSATEMRSAIRGHVQEEMRYREGLALGLDRDDTIVRRRLAQKYDFLLGAQAAAAEPTEAELAAFHARHRDRYAAPLRTGFCQVYFGPQADGLRKARAALESLPAARRGDPDAVAGGGGELPFPRCYEAADRHAVTRDFGAFFAGVVETLGPGRWQGPVESGYGFHLVLPRSRSGGAPRPLAEVRDQVAADWRAANLEAARAREQAELERRYRVTVDEAALRRLVKEPAR